MLLELHEPVTTSGLQQSAVLLSVAMCDTLECPAGFEHRQPAYKMGCVSEVCSLSADGQTCCVRRIQWWMHMLAFFAVFCCLSLLCGWLQGWSQNYFEKLRSKQKRSKIRLPARRNSDESEDHSSQDELLREHSRQNEAPEVAPKTAVASPAASLENSGFATGFPAGSVV
jgi:hypothetical protein